MMGWARTIAVQAADGHSTTTYSYVGNTTLTTDAKGNWKANVTDVNGNLTSVIEPDPSNPAAAPTSAFDCGSERSGMLRTCYTYDVVNNLTHVDMYRSGYDQVRSFTYQPGANWLLTATNPENGTVTYTRDVMGHVTKRVDAAGQTTNYTYDSYDRLKSSDATRHFEGARWRRCTMRLPRTRRPRTTRLIAQPRREWPRGPSNCAIDLR